MSYTLYNHNVSRETLFNDPMEVLDSRYRTMKEMYLEGDSVHRVEHIAETLYGNEIFNVTVRKQIKLNEH